MSPILTYPTFIWHAHTEVTPFNFRRDLWRQKN